MRQRGCDIRTMLKEGKAWEPCDGHTKDVTHVGRLREVTHGTRHMQGVTRGIGHVKEGLRKSRDGPKKGAEHM